MSVTVSALEGRSCERLTGNCQEAVLDDGRGLKCRVASYGATLLSVEVDGVETTVVLDSEHLPCRFGTYGGATCGRVANRLQGATFSLNGKEYSLAKNSGDNSLHGGPGGFHNVNWTVLELISDEKEAGVVFQYVSPDMEEGYPGKLTVNARYSVALGRENGHELRILFTASVEGAETILNICNHAYWNLSNQASSKIYDHTLQLWCPSYVVVDGNCIPSGQIATVENTPFDFCNEPKRLGDRIPLVGKEFFGENFGIDHCFCVVAPDEGASVLEDSSKETLTVSFGGASDVAEVQVHKIAILCDTASNRKMTVLTSQPGVQVYTGNFMPGDHKHAGVALETQHFPDSIHQQEKNPKFAGTVLKPGDKYVQATVHVFE